MRYHIYVLGYAHSIVTRVENVPNRSNAIQRADNLARHYGNMPVKVIDDTGNMCYSVEPVVK